MSVINLKAITNKLSVEALAIGNFDGVHLGHQELLSFAVKTAKKVGKKSGVLTFSPHPRAFFNSTPYSRIFYDKQNYELIKEFGISNIFLQEFVKETSLLSANKFLTQLSDKVEFKTLVVGFDFKLGKERSGGHEDIRAWCAEKGVMLKVIPCKSVGGEKISSSRLKLLLEKGEVYRASRLLGFNYFHKNFIKPDQGLGRKIGFPTLNIHLPCDVEIKNGVYATSCVVNKILYKAISNIGFRPTVSSKTERLVLETHILDRKFVDQIDSSKVKVIFKKFIRSEKKFSSIEELKNQIRIDIDIVKRL